MALGLTQFLPAYDLLPELASSSHLLRYDGHSETWLCPACECLSITVMPSSGT